jgi:hypothetical protein
MLSLASLALRMMGGELKAEVNRAKTGLVFTKLANVFCLFALIFMSLASMFYLAPIYGQADSALAIAVVLRWKWAVA